MALYQPNAQVVADLRARLDKDDIRIFEFPELGTFGFSAPNGIMVEIVPDTM